MTRSRRPILSLAAAGALLGSAAALAAQEPAIAERIEEAERLLAAGGKEAAASVLWQALADLPKVPSEASRRNLGNRIRTLLGTADPGFAERQRLEREAARPLLALAEVYRKKGWYRTALEYARRAETLDPEAARRVIDALVKLVPADPSRGGAESKPAAGAPGEPKDRLAEFFHGDAAAQEAGAWITTPVLVTSPTLVEGAAILKSRQELRGDVRISIEIQPTEPVGCAALLFGSRNGENAYYLAETYLNKANETWAVQLIHWDGNAVHRLKADWMDTRHDAVANPLRLEVEIRGLQLSARLLRTDGTELKAVQATAKAEVAGAIGLFVTANSPSKKPIRFRRLWITKS